MERTGMTTFSKWTLLAAAVTALALGSCSKEEMGAEPGGSPGAPGGEIRFEIGIAPQTRVATDTKFKSTWEDGDAIGIFAVKHGEQLAAADNPIHNVRLTYSSADGGTWSGPAYWPASSAGISELDFYAYHPYDDNGGSPATLNPTAIAFNVAPDQSAPADAAGNTPSAFTRSHLLMAKAADGGADGNGFAKGETVSLTFRHALAMVQVKTGTNMPGKYTVYLNGCTTDAVLNLATQQTSAPATAPQRITMYPCPNDGDGATGTFAYRALVPVQTITGGTVLFRFEINASNPLMSQALTADVALAAGRAETFGFSAPFASVTVSDAVRIADQLEGDKLAAITHLKVFGEMTAEDFKTIKDKMPALTNLDLGGATVVGNEIPNQALTNKSGLKEFVFPRGIVTIAQGAFYQCEGLIGDLVIPAGVTTIGASAFQNCIGFRSLTIPASVTMVQTGAFAYCSSLSSITCHISDPTTVTYGLNVFVNVPVNIPVYVPAASVTAYRDHDKWKQFNNIEAIPQP